MGAIRERITAIKKRMAETQSGQLTEDDIRFLNPHLYLAAGWWQESEEVNERYDEAHQLDIIVDIAFLWQSHAGYWESVATGLRADSGSA